jgi:AT-rich interactive domain-containing protein 4B
VMFGISVLSSQAADEPAYLTVGTDVSAKYRGAFCEAKIKTVKRLVKVKVNARRLCKTAQACLAVCL